MKITPKYKVGDSVMCKAVKEKNDKEYNNILGLITDVKIYMQGSDKMITYIIHWADRDEPSLADENTIEAVREYLLNTRMGLGI